jgi:hypothetical protein
MNPETEKLIIPLERHQAHVGPAPLHAFLLLKESEEGVSRWRFDALTGARSLLELIRSTFNRRVATQQRLRRQFLTVQEWAARIPVRGLTYPRTLAVLDEIRHAIVSDIRCAGTRPS